MTTGSDGIQPRAWAAQARPTAAFGSGPVASRSGRAAQLEYLAGPGAAVMGTSHRQKPVKQLVGRVRAGIAELFVAARRLRGRARQRRHDRVLGRRHLRPGARARAAPHLRRVLLEVRRLHARRAVPRRPDRDRAPSPATRPSRPSDAAADVIAWAHNETSTGVMVPVSRPAGSDGALVLIDATSGAAGLPVDVARRRRLLLRAAEGLRLRRRPVAGGVSPAALERIEEIGGRPATDGRWIPDFLSLPTALENSRKDQTYNTPAIATLLLLADQLDWMLEQGGLDAMVARTTRLERASVRLGRARTRTRRRSSPTRPSARWWSARSTSTTRSTPPRWRRRCAPTGSSTSSPTASSAATSCGSRCSRRPTPPTCRR